MADNLYFPAYLADWNAIRYAITPEQGWALFTMCLDYAAGEDVPSCDDPVLSAFFKLLSGGIDRSQINTEKRSQRGRYARYCQECDKKGTERPSFDEWAEQVDKCRQMPTNANTRDNPIVIQSKSKSESKSNIYKADKPPRTHFTPPTVDEVTAYCRERNNTVDPQRFVDHYTTVGWKVGKNAMKDWKAAVRTWEGRQDHGRDHSYGDQDQEIAGVLRL